MEESHIHQLITEYLTHKNFRHTLEAFETDLKSRASSGRLGKKTQLNDEELADLPRIYSLAQTDRAKSARENVLEKQTKSLEKNYTVVLQAGKQMLALAIDAVQKLKAFNKTPLIQETLESYNNQLTKFHKIFMSVTSIDETEAINILTETNLQEVKSNLLAALKKKDSSSILEQLRLIRNAALSIQAKNRRKTVDLFIKVDILGNHTLNLLRLGEPPITQQTLAIISILSSTARGVSYTLQGREGIIQEMLKILLAEEPGSIIQRLTLACLQKLSVWDERLMNSLIDSGLISWILIEILERGLLHKEYMHPFCLDFGSALLANMVNCGYGLVYLECRQEETLQLMQSCLDIIATENIESCVVIHLLIVLSSLSNEKLFSHQLEQTQFSDRVSEFVENYSMKVLENEDPENRKTILDLCAHLFHPREQNSSNLDTSEVMEFNVRKHQDEIRELEKKLEDENELLIFECFPDEL